MNWLEKLDKSSIFSLYASGLVAARQGNVDKALGTVEDLKTRKGPGTSNMISFLYAAMGDRDKFFEWAERAIDERGFNVGFAIYSRSPSEKAIRADPRFPTLLIRMNLKPDLVMKHQTG